MTDHEAPALDEPKRPAGSGDSDPDDYFFREPELEWREPGPDVWGYLERVWRRVKRADKAT